MARVKSYPNDTTLANNDRLLGTDSASGNATSNFSLNDLKEFVGAGVDVARRTPKLNIPVVNAESQEAVASSIIKKLTPQSVNIHFYEQNPGTPPAGTDVNQINVGTFYVYNHGEGWYLEIVSYESKYEVLSFIGKNFQANVGAEEVTVTGTIGAQQQIDGNKYYYIDSDGDVRYRFDLTRTGDTATTWDMIVNSVETVNRLSIYASNTNTLLDNSGISLDLVTLSTKSNISAAEATFTDVVMDNLVINETIDVPSIPFTDEGNGIDFQLTGSESRTSLSLLADPDGPPAGIANGYIDSDAVFTIQGTTNAQGQESYFNIKSDSFNYNDSIWTTDQSVAQQFPTLDPGNTDRSQAAVNINNQGITYTYFDGTPGGRLVPVLGNDITTNRFPATANRPAGPYLQGVLTHLQIGDDYFTIPTSTSTVAQILPGLSEALTPVPNGNLDIASRRDIGRLNITNIPGTGTNSGILAYSAYNNALGSFTIYEAGSQTLTLGSTGLTNSGTQAITSVTTSATVDDADYILIVRDVLDTSFDRVAVGDTFTLFDNASANTFVVNTTSVSSHTATGVGKFHLFGISPSAASFTPATFDLAQTTGYQAQVQRAAASGASITTGTWFYGIDHGTYAEYRSSITNQPTALTLTKGVSDVVIAQDANLNNAFDGVPTGERLFFTESTNTLPASPTAGDTVFGNVYEVVGFVYDNGNDTRAEVSATFTAVPTGIVSYTIYLPGGSTITTNVDYSTLVNQTAEGAASLFEAHLGQLAQFENPTVTTTATATLTYVNGGVVNDPWITTTDTSATFAIDSQSVGRSDFTFSLIGYGSLIMSSPTIRMTSLSETTAADPDIIVKGDNDELATLSNYLIGGFTSKANYENTGTNDSGILSSISFNDGLQAGDSVNSKVDSGAGALTVDVSARIAFENTTEDTGAFTAKPWKQYVLGDPSSSTLADRTITLPTANLEQGDTIVFHNLSDIDSNGAPVTPNNEWVVTAGTNRIMKDTTDLVVNQSTSFKLIWSAIPSVGWIIE